MFTMETLRYDVVFLVFIIILQGSSSNRIFTYLEEDAILSCRNSSQVIHITNISSIRHNMQCKDYNIINTVSNESIDLLKELCDKKEQCHIYRTNMADNDSYLNALGYYIINCSNQNPASDQQQRCISVSSGNITLTCKKQSYYSVIFDPLVANCADVYLYINDSMKNSCVVTNGNIECMTDIARALVNRTRCFRQFTIVIEYSCKDREHLIVNTRIGVSTKVIIGISFGCVGSIVITGIILSLLIRWKRKLHDEQRLVDRETSNNNISRGNSSSYKSTSMTTESVHTYNTIENDNFRFPMNENPTETDNTKDNYFILEKQTDTYEFAEPVVESKDNYALSEYTVSGQDHHGNADNVPVYAHAADNVYDTSVHKRTGGDGGDLYDHSK